MAWGIGANDVANAMATSVGSRAITVKQAIIIAAIFEFLGAFLAGGEVTSTIRKGIIDSGAVGDANILLYGMLSALLAAAIWLTVASRVGWPVSTTHSIVGAIVGFALVAVGTEAVNWSKMGLIASSWVTSPLLAGTMAFLLILSVKKFIFETADPEDRARKIVPVYIFLTATVVALVTFLKGLKHVGLELSTTSAVLASLGIGILVAVLGAYFIAKIPKSIDRTEEAVSGSIERIFTLLMIVTACAMAFSHGSNDVANAIGPVAAVLSIIESGEIAQSSPVPVYVLLIGALGIVVGLATFGIRVIKTVGEKITELRPSRGFAAELAAASTVVLASFTGVPISTTHTLVGAVLGVGLARGVGALDWSVVKNIAVSWVVTLPVAAVLSASIYFVLLALFT
jgi:PiT family inorganic phosphate transporter